jgi:hypothetical protein
MSVRQPEPAEYQVPKIANHLDTLLEASSTPGKTKAVFINSKK